MDLHSLARMKGFKATLLASCVAMGGISTQAVAQEGDEETGVKTLDQITVTARRVEENQQEVPVTVNTFTGAVLEERGLTNITQIADFTPGLTIDFTSPISGSTASASTFLRGVGQSDFLLTIDPGVGIYVDGVYIARSVGGVVDLLSVDRVEVLKGPQGTLFGRNTIGGAINITSRKPGDEFSAIGEFTGGSFNRRDVRLSADVPVSDTLKVALAFSSKNRDGYARRIPFDGPQQGDILLTGPQPSAFALTGNPFINQAQVNAGELGNENTDSGRIAAYWEPTDRLEFRLAYDYTQTRENGTASTLLATSTPVVTDGTGAARPDLVVPQPFGADSLGTLSNTLIGALFPTTSTPYDDRFITGDPYTTYATGPSFSNLDLQGYSLTTLYRLTDNVDAELILAYRDLEASFGRDGDNSPLVIDHTSNNYNHEQLTAEFKLSGSSFEDQLNWTTGVYYFQEEGDDNVFVPLGSIQNQPPAPLLQLDELNQTENTSLAWFGEASYFLTDRLSVTGGLRYTSEERNYNPIHLDFGNFFLGGPFDLHGANAEGTATLLLPLGEVSQDFTDVSYRAGLEFRVSDDFFVYGNVSTGFKAGGFTGRTVQPVPAPVPFDEEKLTQYELGFKSDFWNNRARLNAAAFFSEYEDIQIVVQEGITPITVNAAAAEIKGFEAEFQAQLTDEFFIIGNTAYIDAQYTDIDTSQFLTSTVNIDSKFANTPEWKASVAAAYEQETSVGLITWRGDWTYTSEIFNNAENTPLFIEPDLHLFNGSVTFSHPSGQWDVVLAGRNLTDEIYIVSGFDQPGVGFTEATYSRPREWSATFKYRF